MTRQPEWVSCLKDVEAGGPDLRGCPNLDKTILSGSCHPSWGRSKNVRSPNVPIEFRPWLSVFSASCQSYENDC